MIWTNNSANSPFGQVPLRMAMEKESHENSLAEGERLEQEAETLKPHHDHKSDQNIEFVCLPTEVDGKVKFVWSKTTTSMQNCYVCGAKVWLTLDTFVIFPMSPCTHICRSTCFVFLKNEKNWSIFCRKNDKTI